MDTDNPKSSDSDVNKTTTTKLGEVSAQRQTAQSAGASFLKLIKQFIITVIVFTRSIIKTFFNFFFALNNNAKLVFLFILILFCLVSFFIGFRIGEKNIKSDVEDELDISYNDLFE